MGEYKSEQIINKYCEDEMRELKRICNPIIIRKGFNLNRIECDELYSVAIDALLKCAESFDDTRNCSFETYLTGVINKRFYDWTRDKRRGIRCNLERNPDGTIKKDEKKNSIVIPDESLDIENEDGINNSEKIASCFNVENAVLENEYDESVQNYLMSLGSIQRAIAKLIMLGYSDEAIKAELALSNSEYGLYVNDMKKYENKKLLMRYEECTKRCEEEIKMVTTTSEKTKNTSYNIEAISKKLRKYILRDDHVLQRASGQWNLYTKSELVSDVLQDKALTQIIISEEIKNGITMHWLIDGKQRCTNLDDYLHDGFAISKNVQVWEIEYQAPMLDENGKQMFNEEGFPIPENRTFDIRNKKFSQLPEELQDKFKEFQVPVMLNLNCTKKDIAYDISRFNRCRPMNVAQSGWTGLDELFAEYVDNILKMDFFKIDCKKSKYTPSNVKAGGLRRIIIEAIIASRYIDNYEKDFGKVCKYLSENANESVFIDFYELVERLNSVLDDTTADMFNMKNSHLWIALFDKFSALGLPDERFAEFLKSFVSTLHTKKINETTYDDLEAKQNTKDKNILKTKMEFLAKLMYEYFGVQMKSEDEAPVQTTEEFIAECIEEDVNVVAEDVDAYRETLEDLLTVYVDENSKLRDDANRNSLLAMMAYSYKIDFDLDNWIEQYAKNNNAYFIDQKKNFLHMKKEFDEYITHGQARISA